MPGSIVTFDTDVVTDMIAVVRGIPGTSDVVATFDRIAEWSKIGENRKLVWYLRDVFKQQLADTSVAEADMSLEFPDDVTSFLSGDSAKHLANLVPNLFLQLFTFNLAKKGHAFLMRFANERDVSVEDVLRSFRNPAHLIIKIKNLLRTFLQSFSGFPTHRILESLTTIQGSDIMQLISGGVGNKQLIKDVGDVAASVAQRTTLSLLANLSTDSFTADELDVATILCSMTTGSTPLAFMQALHQRFVAHDIAHLFSGIKASDSEVTGLMHCWGDRLSTIGVDQKLIDGLLSLALPTADSADATTTPASGNDVRRGELPTNSSVIAFACDQAEEKFVEMFCEALSAWCLTQAHPYLHDFLVNLLDPGEIEGDAVEHVAVVADPPGCSVPAGGETDDIEEAAETPANLTWSERFDAVTKQLANPDQIPRFKAALRNPTVAYELAGELCEPVVVRLVMEQIKKFVHKGFTLRGWTMLSDDVTAIAKLVDEDLVRSLTDPVKLMNTLGQTLWPNLRSGAQSLVSWHVKQWLKDAGIQEDAVKSVMRFFDDTFVEEKEVVEVEQPVETVASTVASKAVGGVRSALTTFFHIGTPTDDRAAHAQAATEATTKAEEKQDEDEEAPTATDEGEVDAIDDADKEGGQASREVDTAVDQAEPESSVRRWTDMSAAVKAISAVSALKHTKGKQTTDLNGRPLIEVLFVEPDKVLNDAFVAFTKLMSAWILNKLHNAEVLVDRIGQNEVLDMVVRNFKDVKLSEIEAVLLQTFKMTAEDTSAAGNASAAQSSANDLTATKDDDADDKGDDDDVDDWDDDDDDDDAARRVKVPTPLYDLFHRVTADLKEGLLKSLVNRVEAALFETINSNIATSLKKAKISNKVNARHWDSYLREQLDALLQENKLSAFIEERNFQKLMSEVADPVGKIGLLWGKAALLPEIQNLVSSIGLDGAELATNFWENIMPADIANLVSGASSKESSLADFFMKLMGGNQQNVMLRKLKDIKQGDLSTAQETIGSVLSGPCGDVDSLAEAAQVFLQTEFYVNIVPNIIAQELDSEKRGSAVESMLLALDVVLDTGNAPVDEQSRPSKDKTEIEATRSGAPEKDAHKPATSAEASSSSKALYREHKDVVPWPNWKDLLTKEPSSKGALTSIGSTSPAKHSVEVKHPLNKLCKDSLKGEASSTPKLVYLRVKHVDKSSTAKGDKELRVFSTRNERNEVSRLTIEVPNELIAKASGGDTSLPAGVYQVFLGDDPSTFVVIERTMFNCFESLLMAWGYLPELSTYRNMPKCQARIEAIWKARKPIGANQRASVKELFQTTLRGFLCEKVFKQILVKLGWSEREMAGPFLGWRWIQTTSKLGLVDLQNTTVRSFLQSFVGDQIWTAAMKCMLRNIGFHGFTFAVKKPEGLSQEDVVADYYASVQSTDQLFAEYLRLAEISHSDLWKLQVEHNWPKWMKEVWLAYVSPLPVAKPGWADKVNSNDPVKLLSMSDIVRFLQDVLTFGNRDAPDFSKITLNKGQPLSEGSPFFHMNPLDITVPPKYQKCREELCTWYCKDASRYPYRGLTLENFRAITKSFKCMPLSDAIFFMCLADRNKARMGRLETKTSDVDDKNYLEFCRGKPGLDAKDGVGARGHGLWETVQVQEFISWLSSDAFANVDFVTQDSFAQLTQSLNLHIPPAKCSQIFAAIVKKRPPHEQHQTSAESFIHSCKDAIQLSECKQAMQSYTSGGLWKNGVRMLINKEIPESPMKAMALKNLDSAFDELDASGHGVLSSQNCRVLLQKLLMPGLPTGVFVSFIRDKDRLGLDMIPESAIHEFTEFVDIDHNGFLDAGEFLTLIRLLFGNVFPSMIKDQMNVSVGQIAKITFGILLNLILAFLLITLVIEAFTDAHGPGQIVHTVASGGAVLMVKGQSDSQMEKQEKAMIESVKASIFDKLTAMMNMSKAAVQKAQEKNQKKNGAKQT
eukprot:TRINITY_DN24427_c0_g1_i1.p1 TRINITY_DN24427_c0_g1~~TRINITY_DN24427_c0_g1_i1.p1  ORF type:complete len:1980 (+),score=394.53 TRINITY_DN24427_c0_g1_i1:95-5941(+)